MRKKSSVVLIIFIMVLVVMFAAVILSHVSFKQPKHPYKQEYFQPIIGGKAPESIEQKDITCSDYSYEMEKLDELLPLVAKESGIAIETFEKREIKGGTYYYESTDKDKIFTFEFDVDQSEPNFTSFSLYQHSRNETENSKTFILGFTISHAIEK